MSDKQTRKGDSKQSPLSRHGVTPDEALKNARTTPPAKSKDSPQRTSRTNLKILARERRNDEYIACCKHNLQWARNKIGPESMSVCIALFDLADGYNFIGELTTANKLYTEALEIVRKKRGEDNDLYAQILDLVLNTQRRMGRDAE